MDLFVNTCVVLTTIGALVYLCFVILYPERF